MSVCPKNAICLQARMVQIRLVVIIEMGVYLGGTGQERKKLTVITCIRTFATWTYRVKCFS